MKGRKFRDIIELFVSLALVVVLNVIVQFTPWRADLTSEKRYTLTDATKEMVAELKDPIYVKVYLEGDLPAELLRLRNATRELLEELKAHSPGTIDYEFIDPSASPDIKTREEIYAELEKEGLLYSSMQTMDGGTAKEHIFFPGAIITFRNQTAPVQLLKTRFSVPDANMVNKSVNNLEYEFSLAMRQLLRREKPRIAFLQGHGEASEIQLADITAALEEQYEVQAVELEGQLNSLSFKPEQSRYRLNRFDMLIIADPDSAFGEKDQLIIDQFAMNGGKIIWCVDAMDPRLDSLRTKQISVATPLPLGLDPMLFAYGVRLNKNMVLDRSCAFIEIFTTPFGNQKKLERKPWYFEPVIIPRSDHPIATNIDPIHTKFISSMDLIEVDSVQQTVLLRTSPFSRIRNNPVDISLNIVDLEEAYWNDPDPELPVAVLLEGRFTSAFKDRFKPFNEQVVKQEMGYRELSKPTSMLVIADGDMIQNRVDPQRGNYYMLGYDRYARQKIYGNREFLINAVDYMLDDKSLISIRSRDITLRKLNEKKVLDEFEKWRTLNMVLPILLVLLFGGLMFLYRKNRFSKAA